MNTLLIQWGRKSWYRQVVSPTRSREGVSASVRRLSGRLQGTMCYCMSSNLRNRCSHSFRRKHLLNQTLTSVSSENNYMWAFYCQFILWKSNSFHYVKFQQCEDMPYYGTNVRSENNYMWAFYPQFVLWKSNNFHNVKFQQCKDIPYQIWHILWHKCSQ